MINQTLYDTRLPNGLAIYLNQFYEYCIVDEQKRVKWFKTPRGEFQVVGYTIEEVIQNYEKVIVCWQCKNALSFILNNDCPTICGNFYTAANIGDLGRCKGFAKRNIKEGDQL